MIVFGYGAPAPWLQIVLGSGVILYWVYRVRKQWRTIGGGEMIAGFIICLLAGWFLTQGVILLTHP